MAAPVVTTDLLPINTCEVITGFTALGGGASGLTQETDYLIQGSFCVSKLCSGAATLKGMWYDFGSGIDLSTGKHLFMWVYCTTPTLIDSKAAGGMRVRVGHTTNTNFKEFYVAGSDTYLRGGWKRIAIDVTGTAGATGGTPTLVPAAAEWFGAQVLTTGTVKANNLGIDAFHYGTSHRVFEGEAGNPGNFTSIVTFENTVANRYGLFYLLDGSYQCTARINIGPVTGSTACRFEESGKSVVFMDWPVAPTFMGITIRGTGSVVALTNVNLSSLSSTVKGDFIVSGSLSTTVTAGVFDNIRIITGDSSLTFDGTAIKNCGLFTQNGATITNCTISPPSGSTGILSNNLAAISFCSFVSGGAGHAIELRTAGTYTFSGNTFSGYGASGSVNSAIYNNSSGSVIINVSSNGDTPTILNGTSATTQVNNTVTLTLTDLVPGSEVRIFASGSTTELGGIESSGATFDYSYTYSAGTKVDIVVLNLSYLYYRLNGYTLLPGNASLPISLQIDREYQNPA